MILLYACYAQQLQQIPGIGRGYRHVNSNYIDRKLYVNNTTMENGFHGTMDGIPNNYTYRCKQHKII